MQDRLPRRAVLATGTLLTLSACLPGADPDPERSDPDLRLRRRAAADVRGLVAAYGAVVAAFPQAGAQQLAMLRALAAEHEAHVDALDGPQPTPPSASASATPAPAPPAVPASMALSVGWLAGLERAAATRRSRQSLRAGADLARLLAAVGACETTHAVLLDTEAGG